MRWITRTIAVAAALAACRLTRAEGTSASSRLQVIEAWGCVVAHQEDVAGAELTEAERQLFLQGAAAALDRQPAPCDLSVAFADVTRLSEERRGRLLAQRRRQNEAAAAAHFAALAKRSDVQRFDEGLYCEPLRPGHGEPAKPRQTVNLRYVGRRLDGTEFIQMDAFDAILVPNRLSRPFYAALQRLKPGSLVRLHVAPDLLAGEEEKLGISPGMAAIFEIEIFDVKPTSAEDLENSLLPSAPLPVPPAPSSLPLATLIGAWGWSIGQQSDAPRFAFSEPERSAFIHGLELGLKELAPESPVSAQAVETFVATERRQAREKAKAARLAAMTNLFAKIDRDPHVVILPDGLRYEILQPGQGPKPHTGDTVIVDYVGRLLDGTVFDRTDNEPLHVDVGSVIPGWNEGIQQLAKGGRIRLYIAPNLGYGDDDQSGVLAKIPGSSALIYEITLLDIQPRSS